jgi:hypothetical protein
MIFSHQTRGAMAQVLAVLSEDAARTFVYKHIGMIASKMPPLRAVVASAPADVVRSMLVELLTNNKMLRSAAPKKFVFDAAIGELERWVLLDGWVVERNALVRVTPMAEEVTGVLDKLIDDLATSGFDHDAAIRTALDDSSKSFVAQPPDFNGSITKVRIALETVAHRAAVRVAAARRIDYSKHSWGKALQFLKLQGVLEQEEEEVLARVYTFISPGAHVPKGMTDEEWARLARTFAVSSTYFLLRKCVAA